MDDKTGLTPQDFTTDQQVRWCPACGHLAIITAGRASLAEIGRAPHEVVFVSGIGCAARFPYYIKSYGFHSIHGRAPAVASGVKLANPDLDVWVVGGDGDLLSIGGNHLIHTLRRDIDLNILLFNNAIYGLTKGQFSPASPLGTKSPTSPQGSEEPPVNAALLALGSGATFVSRTADTMLQHLAATLKRAHRHKGAALVEIFQNCIVYNDTVWGGLSKKTERADLSILLEQDRPLVFGQDSNKGLCWKAAQGEFEIIEGNPEEVAKRATLFDETNLALAAALAGMRGDGLPIALGVIYCKPVSSVTHDPAAGSKQRLDAKALQLIVNGEANWQVASS